MSRIYPLFPPQTSSSPRPPRALHGAVHGAVHGRVTQAKRHAPQNAAALVYARARFVHRTLPLAAAATTGVPTTPLRSRDA